MTKAIEVKMLTKHYGKITAIDMVNFNVEKGEMFGLIGPDGAGKSTIYKILATLLSTDSGTALINGMDVSEDYRKIRAKIGYMPEHFSLYQDLSVKENLNFFASLFNVNINDNYDLIAPIFSQLERFPNRKAGALSGGMKQKLALSCALIHRPEILLLDEPTTGVDAVSRNEFWEMLSTLKHKGITILVSTSYMDEAKRCDRIAMIDKGHILEIDSPEKLVAGINENLFNAVADEMFPLLSNLRKNPEVINCYTFGATLHLAAKDGFNPDMTVKELEESGLRNVKIYPASGDIEDLFIKLTKDDDRR